jgi:hypothetical protein
VLLLAATSPGARGGTEPLPLWEGRSGPHRLAQAHRSPRGPASICRGPNHPTVDRTGGSRSCASRPRGLVEALDLLEHGGRSGDRDPSCQSQAVRPVTQSLSARLRITSRPSGWTHQQEVPLSVCTDRALSPLRPETLANRCKLGNLCKCLIVNPCHSQVFKGLANPGIKGNMSCG